MRLAQDGEMVHTLALDRSDQPFGKAILPRRGRCIATLQHANIQQMVNAIAIKPSAARNFLKALRSLMTFAVEVGTHRNSQRRS